jgi:hypothetical protein
VFLSSVREQNRSSSSRDIGRVVAAVRRNRLGNPSDPSTNSASPSHQSDPCAISRLRHTAMASTIASSAPGACAPASMPQWPLRTRSACAAGWSGAFAQVHQWSEEPHLDNSPKRFALRCKSTGDSSTVSRFSSCAVSWGLVRTSREWGVEADRGPVRCRWTAVSLTG